MSIILYVASDVSLVVDAFAKVTLKVRIISSDCVKASVAYLYATAVLSAAGFDNAVITADCALTNHRVWTHK